MSVPEAKHKQHFVFQAYLKAWTNNNQIWCRRNGNYFLSNTINIAQKRDFYRVLDINSDERKFLFFFWRNKPPEVKKIMEKYLDALQFPYTWANRLKHLDDAFTSTLFRDRPVPAEYHTVTAEMNAFLDVTTNNMVEEMYSEEEGDLADMLRHLLEGNANFYYTPEPAEPYIDTKQKFLHCVCSQYFRTKALRTRLVSALMPSLQNELLAKADINPMNLRADHIVPPLLWFVCTQLTDSLMESNACLTLLQNHTDVHFITGDQPVINLCANYRDLSDQADDAILYYPLSPNMAILINGKSDEKEIHVEPEDIDVYNRGICNASEEMIFADSSSLLERYSNCP